jgi:multicomponent Na+:H+ antiporter subunit D
MKINLQDIYIIGPFLIPLLAAGFCLLFISKVRFQKIIALGAALLLLLNNIGLMVSVNESGMVMMKIGGIELPYGIAIVADHLSALLLLTGSAAAFFHLIFFTSGDNVSAVKRGLYPVLLLMLMGVNGALLAGDLFNLYVWYEVMVSSSFVLIVIQRNNLQLEGGFKYITINLVSSGIMLMGIGVIYLLTGALNFAQVAVSLGQIEQTVLLRVSGVFFLVSFLVKSGAFPFYFWLPSAYPFAPVASLALMAGLLTKVGVYNMIRIFSLFYLPDQEFFEPVILIAAAGSLLAGTLGAIHHQDIRKIFSYFIIGHIGFSLMGLGLFSLRGLQGSVIYLVHDMLTKTGLFMLAGHIFTINRSFDLKFTTSGLSPGSPTGWMYFIIAFSIAGIPPFSGFWGKIALVWAGLEVSAYRIVLFALGGSLLTLMVVGKVWVELFWKEGEKTVVEQRKVPLASVLAAAGITTIILVISFYIEPLAGWGEVIGRQLIDKNWYIQNVLP